MFFWQIDEPSITLFSINGGALSQIAQTQRDARDEQKFQFEATPFRIFLVATLTWAFRFLWI